MLLHYGFETPTKEIMQAWGAWFTSINNHIVDQGGHFTTGQEISKKGTKDLPLGADSITGYTIIESESIEQAHDIASKNPFIKSIRIYEMMTKP